MSFFDETPEVVPAKRRFTQSALFPWFIVLVILVVLLIIFSPVTFVRAGHRGVTTFFGDTQGDLFAEGAHLKYPLLRVRQFDIRTQTRDVSAGVVTEDMQLVTAGVTVSYRLDLNELRHTFEDVGKDVETKIIDPATKEAINVVATKFTAEELISKRADFKTSVVAELETRLAESGVIVENVAVVSIDFSNTLKEAFEAETVAEQELAAAKLRSETAELDQDIETRLSESELERIRNVGEALRGNEAYIQYEIMKKWNGRTPLYLAPTASVPVTNE